MSSKLKRVLTIQSHVAFGHVGNAAAVFTLQRLGIEAMPIHTVQFSNHTGYELFTGDVFSATHIKEVISGLVQNNLLADIDAILSGYLGSTEIGDVIRDIVYEVRKSRPDAIYLCDPVMGDKDDDCGFFVNQTIPPFMRETLNYATIITPNYFEFEVLCEKKITTIEAACKEARLLIAKHQQLTTILITSFRNDGAEDQLLTLAITEDEAWKVTTPRCDYSPMPSGMGDAFAALYLGHTLKGDSIERALSYTTSSLYALVKGTENGSKDLSLIHGQAHIIEPSHMFKAECI